MNELKKILKGNWNYNVENNVLHCQQNNVELEIYKKEEMFFQQTLSFLNSQGTPSPHLKNNIPTPTIRIPLELFHRIVRANTILYEPNMTIYHDGRKIMCKSQHITIPLTTGNLGNNEIIIDPQTIYRITKNFQIRERIISKIMIYDNSFIISFDFPWIYLKIKITP